MLIYTYNGSSEIDRIELEEVVSYELAAWDDDIYIGGSLWAPSANFGVDGTSIMLEWVEPGVCGNRFYYDIKVTCYFKDGSVDTDLLCVAADMYMYCLAEGTEITLADKTTKTIENITYNDELLVWDFDKAEFATANPLWIQKTKIAQSYNLLKFDNGAELKTIHQHRIMNKEMGKFTYPMSDETPIGTTTFTDEGTEAKLISKEVVEEQVAYYNIITDYHMNLFANGILTSCRLSNLYPIKDMKYVKDNRELLTNEDYPSMPEEYFKGLRMAEQPKVANRDNDVKFFEDWEGYVKNLIHNAVPRDEEIRKS